MGGELSWRRSYHLGGVHRPWRKQRRRGWRRTIVHDHHDDNDHHHDHDDHSWTHWDEDVVDDHHDQDFQPLDDNDDERSTYNHHDHRPARVEYDDHHYRSRIQYDDDHGCP